MGVAGIPTIGFGPGDESVAHTADEGIRLEDVFKSASAYALLAVELLAKLNEEKSHASHDRRRHPVG
jgi:acetylornithine deacetylase/succinyl-diaminopimelate desuccinylase-like protein